MRFIVYDLESFSNYFTATTLELFPRDPNEFSWREMEDGELKVSPCVSIDVRSTETKSKAIRGRKVNQECLITVKNSKNRLSVK